MTRWMRYCRLPESGLKRLHTTLYAFRLTVYVLQRAKGEPE